MTTNLSVIIALSSFIFFIAALGILFNNRNIIIIFLCIELILISININFIFCSIALDDLHGIIFSLLILSVAAAEVALGLSIFVNFYRINNHLSITYFNNLHG